MIKKICFDMDGTVYDLYGVEEFDTMLRSKQSAVYALGSPLVDMEELGKICRELSKFGWFFSILTHGAYEYDVGFYRETARVKKAWAREYMPYVTEFHLIPYGTPKQRRLRHGVTNNRVILVDDNDDVREMWNGESIDAKGDILAALRAILMQEILSN